MPSVARRKPPQLLPRCFSLMAGPAPELALAAKACDRAPRRCPETPPPAPKVTSDVARVYPFRVPRLSTFFVRDLHSNSRSASLHIVAK